MNELGNAISGKKKSDITEEAVGEGRGGSGYNSAEGRDRG